MIFALPIVLLSASCSKKTVKTSDDLSGVSMTTTVERRGVPKGATRPAYVPMASVFRMSGDYANNVAVGVGSDGRLTYFPAPTDITENSCPVEIGNGWWLNRQGIGKGYRFTRFSFSEYAALKQVPTTEELLESLIPGAVVTEVRQLDIPASDAMLHLPEIRKMLNVLEK